jgi:hypothetical protein
MIDEQMILNETAQAGMMAENYRKKYRTHVDALEHSMLNKVVGVNEFHITQLGKQLDAFSIYSRLCEANGTLNNLGQLPRLAFDVITASMGQSILSIIATVQTIGSQKGIVHYRNVEAKITKGNLTAGQNIVDPTTGVVHPQGYASNEVREVIGTGDGTEDAFAAVLSFNPTRNQFLQILVGGTVVGRDQGDLTTRGVGQIWGNGVSGTVNYATGAVALTFAASVANAVVIEALYQENYEASEDIPRIEAYWASKDVEAKVYALKATVGMLQQFVLQKEYGEAAMDELSKDLIRAVNTEIGGELIRLLRSQSVGTTSFNTTPSAGVSFFDHKMQYFDKLNEADSELLKNAGRGQVSVMVVGRDHAAFVAGLPGFQKLSDGRTLGAHVFGTLNGITYVRVPEDSVIGGPKAGVGIFRGDSPFDAAAVYAPYMPLMSTADLPELRNPLVSQKAVATMAGVQVLVKQYATKFDIA